MSCLSSVHLQLEVASGQEGEICVSGPNVMEGYRNNEEANKEVFSTYEGFPPPRPLSSDSEHKACASSTPETSA
jgi:acyl-CoA synthetase (AMP-forming)/AMP-acid ligase II